MKSNTILKAAVAATLIVGSAQAMATGYVNLPTSGASSAYIECNTTGDYGDGTSTRPTIFANNTCAVFLGPTFDGYVQNASAATRQIVMNNTYTGFSNVTVGTINDQVWFNPTTKSYVYSLRVNMNETPYAELPSEDDPEVLEDAYFEINDIQRLGFANVGAAQIAYRVDLSADEVLFRAGRTATAVPAPPVGAALPDTTTAPWNADVVDFTTDVNNEDPDGSSPKDSAFMYIKFTDSSSTTSGGRVTTGAAFKLKQLGQEGQPLITIDVNGYKPSF